MVHNHYSILHHSIFVLLHCSMVIGTVMYDRHLIKKIVGSKNERN